jgi:hypothetical protein
MGEFSESGFPHKTNSGTKYAHRRNQVHGVYGIAWEGRKILRFFQALETRVAKPHLCEISRCLNPCGRRAGRLTRPCVAWFQNKGS